jgi:molybdopterin converting factor small subunit
VPHSSQSHRDEWEAHTFYLHFSFRSTPISIKIILPTAFVRHTDGKKQLTSEAANLPGLIADIDQNFPALSTQIKDDSGKLRRFINIYVNDEDIRFLGGETYAFQDGDEVMLIPSIAGGC